MNKEVRVPWENMVVFLAVWYLFTITTYGTNVPAGLFLPGMIIGCALGRSLFTGVDGLGLAFYEGNDDNKDALNRSYIILACGAFMAGYTRMTYSLAILIMETSQDIEIFTPMIISIAIANQVGYLFTRSLYERATRTKQMPILKDTIPPPCEVIIAAQIMSRDVVTVQNVESVQNILKACKKSHHAFPVLNSRGNVVGLIPKNYVLILLEARAFYREDGVVEDEADANITNDRSLSRNKTSALNMNKSVDRGSTLAPNYTKKGTFNLSKMATYTQFTNLEDDSKFPPTPPLLVLPWRQFGIGFWSKDLELTAELKAVSEYYENDKIDFRPY